MSGERERERERERETTIENNKKCERKEGNKKIERDRMGVLGCVSK